MSRRFLMLVTVLATVVLVAAACSSSSSDSNDTGDSATTTAANPTGNDENEVDVTLTEFAIEMSQTDFVAGQEYTFRVTNAGVVPHELMLSAPITEDGSMDMEQMDEMAFAVFEEDELPPGATVEGTVVFPEPGPEGIEASCHIAGHYDAGMVLPLTVTG